MLLNLQQIGDDEKKIKNDKTITKIIKLNFNIH